MESSHSQFLCLAIATILQLSPTEQCTMQGDVRLVGGQNQYEGRVEVCDGGEWKTACDRMWLKQEAMVVCRQLNYSDPSNATYVRRGCAGQGHEDQDTLRVKWKCSGQESRLLDCTRTNTEVLCDHRRDAGVYCSGQTPDNCQENELRLVDGPNYGSGRVEVCRFGCWGTVCDEGWDRDDTNVACRQVGFETNKAIPTKGGYFGNVSSDTPIHVLEAKCGRGGDRLLVSCSSFVLADNNCTHSQDAGVFCNGTSNCQDGGIRLIGGEMEREGRVEMCFNGVWGAVCANGWDDIAANITCSQLGYSLGNHTFILSIAQVGNSPLIFDNITCSENYSTLLQCVDVHHFGLHDCENGAAGVICEMPSLGHDNTTTTTTSATTESDLTSPAVTVASNSQSSLLGVIGGVLAVGVITAIGVASVIILAVVVVVKRIKIKKASDSGIDNPTYDERQGASTLNNTMVNVIHDESEREFENPDEIIDTLRIDPTNSADSQLQSTSHYERVHLESATVNEILYESADIGVFQAAQVSLDGRGPDNTNGIEASYGDVMKGATSSEGVYELPPNMDGSAAGGDLDESCYSTLNPTYAQLQAHIGAAKPGPETQNQHNDSDYSHLKF